MRNAQVLLEKQPGIDLLLFQALGFMEVAPHPEDSRFRVYAPSDEACREARLMLTALTESLALLYPEREVYRQMRDLDDREFLALYFKGFAMILAAELTVDVLLPECYWLVKRDAGHLLMLAIYNDAFAPENDRATFRSSSYLALAKQLSVSKTHIIRMVQEGLKRVISKPTQNPAGSSATLCQPGKAVHGLFICDGPACY